MPEDWYDKVARMRWQDYDCPYCSAKAEEWCVTSGGHLATSIHVSRGYELQQLATKVWADGYKNGQAIERNRMKSAHYREQVARA